MVHVTNEAIVKKRGFLVKNTRVRSYVVVPLERRHHPQISEKVPGSFQEKTKCLPKYFKSTKSD